MATDPSHGCIRSALALGVLLGAMATAAPAAARELVFDDGRWVVDAGAFYKTQGTYVRLPHGLVAAADALLVLEDELRAQLPPAAAATIPESVAVPAHGAVDTHTVRVWGRSIWAERLELAAAWQLSGVAASSPMFLLGTGLGGVIAQSEEAPRRRLVDFEPVLAEEPGLRLLHNLDQLALTWRSAFGDVTAGRQVLSWGSGRLWNPTDLLSPFAPTDVDREVRRGVDALRASIPLASTAQLELLWLPQPTARDNGGVARAHFNLGGFDFAPSAAKYVRDGVIGLDASGDLGPLGVHAEAAWTAALDKPPHDHREQFVRAVAGVDVRPLDDLIVTSEYYFNGWGAHRPSGYLEVLRSSRVTRGEVFGAGRHYLGLAPHWQATELLSLAGTTVINLTDPSVLIVPALEYSAEQSVLLRLGGYLPIGRGPDPRGLRNLTADDAIAQTAAWTSETRSLGFRSEYGASPLGVFAQVALYLQ